MLFNRVNSFIDLAISQSLGHLMPLISVKNAFMHFIQKNVHTLVNKVDSFYYQKRLYSIGILI